MGPWSLISYLSIATRKLAVHSLFVLNCCALAPDKCLYGEVFRERVCPSSIECVDEAEEGVRGLCRSHSRLIRMSHDLKTQPCLFSSQ